MLPTLSKLNGLKVELSPGQNIQSNETRNSKIERKNETKTNGKDNEIPGL